MLNQHTSGKYIKQIKLQGNKNYFPNKFYSPYDFINKFNQAIEKRYDLKVVEARYIISKSKYVKDIDDHYNTGINQIDRSFNNIYDIDDPQMKDILSDTILLLPPKDFDYDKLQEETEAMKKKEEERKLQEIDRAIQLLSDLYARRIYDKIELRSIDSFKMKLDPILKDSQVEIFIKAVMNGAIEEKIQTEKNSKNPVIIQSTGKQQIRVYLHPVKCDNQNYDTLAKLSPITDWSLCSLLPASLPKSNSDGITYWSMQQIGNRAADINQSTKIQHYIAIHKNKRGINDSLEVYSFLFNQIVLKTVINLAQIKSIDFIHTDRKITSTTNIRFSDYYLHLAYPPRYYISILKPDFGCDDGYIRSWQRVENFMFIRNQSIMKDQFIRLFLFNNTIFKIRIEDTEQQKPKFQNSRLLLRRIIDDFKGTINCSMLQKNWLLGQRVSTLNTIFKYNIFSKAFQLSTKHSADKIWKLKYLLLVLIRFNSLTPPQVEKILLHLEKNQDDLDIYIYIFWQSVSILGTVNPETQIQKYENYLLKQYNQIKKLGISDITNKVSSNTQTISFVFKAFLTPSGYIYNPPTPQMKGRLLKEYCKQSEHFMRVTITDDNEGTLKNQKYITKKALKDRMKRIYIVDREYIPLGWSPSQLRSYSLWYIHEYSISGQRLKREQVLSFLGVFDKIANPAKKAARIGQAFSASWTYLCKQNEIKELVIPDDYSSKGYMYTDGIGKISANLIQRMSLKLHIRELSVLQIRYKGAKGILVKDDRLPKNTIHLRQSMVKYDCNHESAAKYLDILDWNKYKAGFLNRQTIILLKSLGIDDRVFQKRQNQHIYRISNLSFKDCSIFKHMNEDLNTDISNLQPANVTILHLLRAGFRLEEEPFFRGVLQTMKKNGYHQLKIKSNIMIKDSARIIGIIDEYDILEEGEVYCTVFDNLTLNAKKQHVQGEVIITRNPCLHPADIRKMKCISEAEASIRFQRRGEENVFSELVNCVIFPKKGQFPVTAQISGSDLDGDNFFISWDRELIPKQMEKIYLYDDAPVQKKQGKTQIVKKTFEVQYQEMLDFFIQYLNYEKLGQIDNSHLVKADQSQSYAKSKDCIELAEIHGKAVDFPKSGYCPQVDPRLLVSRYPDFMQKQESPEYESNSILGKLYQDIKLRIKNLLQECEAQKSVKIDEEIIRELLLQETQESKQIMFDNDQIKETLQIILNYERELSGLITLVGVDTEYQIYSGNFTIAKEKVKIFGKNRLISTILALRARYFEQFFSTLSPQDRIAYEDAKQNDLEDAEYFTHYSRRRTLLYYLCSYVIKFHKDEQFLNDQTFGLLRKTILSIFSSLSHNSEGKYCGFVWFVVPKILINQKYRVRRNKTKELENKQQQKEQKQQDVAQQEQVI